MTKKRRPAGSRHECPAAGAPQSWGPGSQVSCLRHMPHCVFEQDFCPHQCLTPCLYCCGRWDFSVAHSEDEGVDKPPAGVEAQACLYAPPPWEALSSECSPHWHALGPRGALPIAPNIPPQSPLFQHVGAHAGSKVIRIEMGFLAFKCFLLVRLFF